MSSQPWHERVSHYLDGLEAVAEEISSSLESSKVDTVAGDPAVERSTDRLRQALGELETQIAAREDLLKAPDAPVSGSTLTEKLKRSDEAGSDEVGTRCERVAESIAMANHRAVSLFVCQYHLADFGAEIIRLLSGADAPSTYGGSGQPSGGGTLFNEAA